jgi:hypothetical protein
MGTTKDPASMRCLSLVWPGLLVASTLFAPGCKRESSRATVEQASAASAASLPAAKRTTSNPETDPQPQVSPDSPDSADTVPIELPAPPKPPDLRNERDQADAEKILAGYGFPAHQSLTPLCGWRGFNPGGTTWFVDLFTSPESVATLRMAYEKRLGQRGLEHDTWSVPASGAIERQLSLKPLVEVQKYTRCTVAPPDNARTLVVARRAR